MKWLLSLLLVVFLYTPGFSQELGIAKRFKLLTPESEVSDAILHLESLPEEDRPFTKYLSTYAIPEEKRINAVLAGSFMCHSLQGVTTKNFQGGGYYPLAKIEKDGDKEVFIPIQLVPGSKTLWYIDLRHYNWTEKAWETIVKEDGYFLEPVVPHDKAGYLRLLSGNSVSRMDWFIFHAASIVAQVDNQSKVKIYRELLYAPLTKGPANVKEFETIWGIDTKNARDIGNVFATLTTKSKQVARHNRILFGYRTELGWYFRTYDVLNTRGRRDYAENLISFKGNPPDIFDGGEIFATNALKLQVYDLYNQKEELADDAAAGLARHMTDVLGDVRVRVPHSCFDCHAAGPLPSENTVLEFIKGENQIYTKDKADQLRIDRVYLDNKFEDAVDEYQILFAKSLLKVNGCTPTKNFNAYSDIITWYDKPVDLEQAAFECGVTPEQYKRSMTDQNKLSTYKLPIRIAKMISEKNSEPIPRETWEAPPTDGQPGLFEQSMIMIHGLTKITDLNLIVVKQDCSIYIGKEVIGNVKVGTKLVYLGTKQEGTHTWYEVKFNGKTGYIYSGYCETK
jgi:hypothetical protein